MATQTQSTTHGNLPPRPSLTAKHGQAKRWGEKIINGIIFFSGVTSILFVALIFLFILREAFPLFQKYPVQDFFLGKAWNPTGENPELGLVPLLFSSLLVTLGAVAIAIPLGVGSAVYIAEVAPPRIRQVLKTILELLAAVPSVVFGFFGAVVLGPFLLNRFGLTTGDNMLHGSLLLALMAVPTIATISEDALAAVPKEVREGSLGLGATHWQTVQNVLFPAAASGIVAAVMLGIGRAIGETMVVLMVTGNGVGSHLNALMNNPAEDAPNAAIGAFQHTFGAYTEICRTLTATIAAETGEVVPGALHYNALFMLGVVLFLITMIINLTADAALRRTEDAKSGSSPHAASALLGVLAIAGGVLGIGTLYLLLDFVGQRTGAVGILGSVVVIAATGWFLRPRSPYRRFADRVFYAMIGLGAMAVLLPTFYIFGTIVVGGLPAMNLTFLTQPPNKEGIGPAILGTLALMFGTILLAMPLGIFAAIYLNEYAKKGWLVRAIRMAIVNLAGVPSIVHGLFGLVIFRIFLGAWFDFFTPGTESVWQNRTLLWGAATLAILVLPIIITTTEEALKTVPPAFREGSFGLGATKWQTIRHVVLPAAIPGILTGAILALGRAAGETAPILFTAVVGFSTNLGFPTPNAPVLALPYQLYYTVTEAIAPKDTTKFGIALTLLVLVFIVNLTAILLRARLRRPAR